jgi:release factor glutamine methyltransferase
MLPTPSTRHVPYELIYEPAEDSFLFLDTLSSVSETQWLHGRFSRPHYRTTVASKSAVPLVVELGPGSGVIVAFLTANANTIFGTDVLSLSVDVNAHAATATRTTVQNALLEQGEGSSDNEARVNKSTYLSSLLGDLTSPLLSGQVDVLVFNPPYVPTESAPQTPSTGSSTTKPSFEESSALLELSYAGGIDGMEVTNRLLAQIPNTLSLHGVAYVLFCKGNRPEEVKTRICAWEGGESWSWRAVTVGTSGKTAGWEKLEIVRIWREWK